MSILPRALLECHARGCRGTCLDGRTGNTRRGTRTIISSEWNLRLRWCSLGRWCRRPVDQLRSPSRRSCGTILRNYFLLSLPDRTQVPTFEYIPQVNAIQPLALARGRRSWGGKTIVCVSGMGRHPVHARHKKYGKEPPLESREHDTRLLHGLANRYLTTHPSALIRLRRPLIIQADGRARTAIIHARKPPLPGSV
jgi:hypothetical protein